jgi:LytR cell envelope-related transcriptional attenuator
VAAHRTDGALLEPSRRLVRAAVVAAAAFALTGTAALLIQPRPEQVPGHAYAIPAPGKRIRVEVLNGTRRSGFARTATRALRAQGLDVVFFGTGPQSDSTRIFVRRGDPGLGRDVAEALGAGRVIVQPDTLRRVDVSVLLGSDWRPRLPPHP